MKARDMMNDFAVEVAPEDSVLDAALWMKNEGVGLVCVCGPDHLPIGVLTAQDLAVRVCATGRSAQDTKVREVMTPDPIACSQEASAKEVIELMKGQGLGHILVLDDAGRLAGTIGLAEVWHHESPLAAGDLSRSVTQPQVRVQTAGARHLPSMPPGSSDKPPPSRKG